MNLLLQDMINLLNYLHSSDMLIEKKKKKIPGEYKLDKHNHVNTHTTE